MNPYIALLIVLVFLFPQASHRHTTTTEYVVVKHVEERYNYPIIDFGDICRFDRGWIDVGATNPLGTSVRTVFSFKGMTPNQVARRITDEYYDRWLPHFGAYGGTYLKNKAREYGVIITLGGNENWDVRPIINVTVNHPCS